MSNTILNSVANHLWQSTAFALTVALVVLAFRKNRASVRYWLWLCASMKFLVPFAVLIGAGNAIWDAVRGWSVNPAIPPSAVSQTLGQLVQPFAQGAPLVETATHAAAASFPWQIAALVGVWGCGVLAIGVMRLRAWLRVRAMLRGAKAIDISAAEGIAIDVRSSATLLEPGVVGLFRSVLLLPEGIVSRLTRAQLEAVLAHEFAHIRRRDNLTAALHMLVEAIFWFHPAVWWIGARLVEEREHACDEAVLSRGNEPRDYAEAILSVCKLYVESPLVCVAGVTGAELKKRIHAILGGRIARELGMVRKVALAAAAVVALALPVLMGIVAAPALRAQSDAAPMKFEVASVKRDPRDADYIGEHIHMGVTGNHYIATGLSAKYLIQFAYGMEAAGVSGGPSWITADKYDIDAKIDDAVLAEWKTLDWAHRYKQEEQIKSMLRSLLEDRFQLKLQHETKEMPVYALVVAKSGPKFGPPKDPSVQGGTESHDKGDGIIFTLTNSGLDNFVKFLSRQREFGGHMVVDQTGLTGHYDFTMTWTPQSRAALDQGLPADSTGTSIWTAVQEQLGLKLESRKAPVDTLVIEGIEKPSEN